MNYERNATESALTNSVEPKRVVILTVVFLLAVFFDPGRAQGQQTYYIFDWPTFSETHIPGVIPSPHIGNGGSSDDWPFLYDANAAHGATNALMMRVLTSPHVSGQIFGAKAPGILQEVLDYIDTNDLYMNFVFADYECSYGQVTAGICTDQDVLDSIDKTVAMVTSHGNPNISGAAIGQYNYYPGAQDRSELWGEYDRTEAAATYLASGLNIAMPSLYPNSAHRNHHTRPDLHDEVAVSIAHALFWTPLERYSSARRALPDGHMIIPWMGGLIRVAGYEAPVPSREEVRSLIQHIRLRGADGYYTWSHGDNINYASRPEFRDDVYQQGWRPLDWFFELAGDSRILNLGTNKSGGLEWSGVRRGDRVLMVFSNYTAAEAQVDLGHLGMQEIPRYSPPIPPGGHILRDYTVGPQVQWQFNEGQGGTTSQSEPDYPSPFGNPSMVEGTLSGVTWVPGVVGQALKFNGWASVDLGDVYDLGTADRTISLWFRASSNRWSEALLSKGTSIGNSVQTIYLRRGKLKARVVMGGTRFTLTSNRSVADGQWHHVALVIDRDARMRLYLDGKEERSVDISARATTEVANDNSMMLGRTGRGNFYRGELDGLRIYSSALDAAAILDDYSGRLLARLDSVSGSLVIDESISRLAAMTPCESWTRGKYGGALGFDHGCGVDFGDVLDLGAADRTISLWLRTTSSGSGEVLLSKGDASVSDGHAISISGGMLQAELRVAGVTHAVDSGSPAVNDGNWHHLVLVIDRDNSMAMYVDGSLRNSTSVAALAGVDIDNTAPLQLGQSPLGQYFNGELDEVKVYHRALNEAERALARGVGW